MAKYRRRRIYRKRKNWSPNITRIQDSGEALGSERFTDAVTITQNPGQANNRVPIQYTVKNIEVACSIEARGNSEADASIQDIEYYIVYVPEGYVISGNLPFEHPEWIMAYKYVGQSITSTEAVKSNAQTPKIKTRLSRKLKSGDSIVFLISGYNTSATSAYIRYSGLVRWWTKAN